MLIPDESLDDFVVKAVPERITEPPRPVSLRFTGEVEVLKPLTTTYVRAASQGLSWFHRSLVMGGGFAFAALVLVSAILIGMYEPSEQPELSQVDTTIDRDDLAKDGQHDGLFSPAEETLASDIFTTVNSLPTSDNPHAIRSNLRSRPAKTTAQPATYQPSRKLRRSQLVVSSFVPTTLVIFAENGEIKTRIEPQITAGFQNQHALPN